MTTDDFSYIGQLFVAASEVNQRKVNNAIPSQGQQELQEEPVAAKPLVQPQLQPTLPEPSKRRNAKHDPFSYIPVELSENGQSVRLRLDISGIQAEDLSVHVQQGVLVIEGVRTKRCHEDDDNNNNNNNEDGENVVLKSHRFCRRYGMKTNILDVKNIKASLSAKGVLTILVPKKCPDRMPATVTDNEEEPSSPISQTRSLLGSWMSSSYPELESMWKGGANCIPPEKPDS